MATEGKADQPGSIVPPDHFPNTSEPANVPAIPDSLKPVLKCGPLLRYHGTDYSPIPKWRGSVLVVVESGLEPEFALRTVDNPDFIPQKKGVKLLEEKGRCFWRFGFEVELKEAEGKVDYAVTFSTSGKVVRSFSIPGKDESMRFMARFSFGTNEAEFSGPALWHDVLRVHHENPFHVAIGGGDQIYNDGVRAIGPLKTWSLMNNPVTKRSYPWSPPLSTDTDEWYYNNYVGWYTTPPFSHAISQIPTLNIWDDHDIIDGYGSYTDNVMSCPVFRGLAGVAKKYYMLFQHHTPPAGDNPEDPNWILGGVNGKYFGDPSRSLYARLGKRVAFVGIDARGERTRHMINEPTTYSRIFERLDKELADAGGGVKHLFVLLGIPIAYPRLTWLGTILRSPFMGFIRFLNKRFGIADSLFNGLDGSFDLLDDVDDHYTASTHKIERNNFLIDLQRFAKKHEVRITILSGDVHLAAIGRFHSNPPLAIPIGNDHRFIANVISSAMTNVPVPEAGALFLAGRNRIHKLGAETEEKLLDFFDTCVRGGPRLVGRCTMPHRNYCVITESPQHHVALVPGEGDHAGTKDAAEFNALGEYAGQQAEATAESAAKHVPGSLDVTFRVEVDKADAHGKTRSYRFTSKFPPILEASDEGAKFSFLRKVPELKNLPEA